MYSCTGALTYLLIYLFTYIVGSRRLKPAVSQKSEVVEEKAKVTIKF